MKGDAAASEHGQRSGAACNHDARTVDGLGSMKMSRFYALLLRGS